MASKGVGKLHFIDGNVDTNKYLAILEESLLPVMEECLTSGQDFVFQQDGAACHTKKAIKWMEENNVPLLKWVSSSPDLSPIETLWHEMKKLLSVFGNGAPHQSTISRWYGELKRGRVGAPKTAVTQENVDVVRKLIIEDRHVTYREIEASLKISKTSIQKILHEELGVRKLVFRWIPHLLTEEQKAARVNWCQKTLDRFNSGNSKNLSSIVSGDESLIYCYELGNKRQSAPTKVIRSRSILKRKDGRDICQTTVTADWYTTICFPKVITELQKINPEIRIILHQDNESSHTAQRTGQYLTEENVKLLDHPPYSPNLIPNDFFTFPKIKNRLRGQRFQSPDEAVDAFKDSVMDLPANEWNKCFENWFERMQMCIHLRGEYFEKQ
ncbi:unnamed protein product [Acanthoscelides obtectus]|uniref:Transposase n=1 Tax=Acanthoscelides obtectus TaxID=200917 RepID=A0A9P0Q2W7_ACAOB|nr:unnamed protein product [Acanthoscelides obtectus]CAK1635347.1 Histone-lysine N-methyltransferase SETMAR [Acanthoscelides obtectus]